MLLILLALCLRKLNGISHLFSIAYAFAGNGCDQTQYQMAIIGIFTVDLAGVSRQERLEGAEHLFNQVPTRPDPQQTRGANLCGQTEQVDAILTELVYQDQGDFAIGSTLSPQAGIATAWCLQTLTPGPMVTLD